MSGRAILYLRSSKDRSDVSIDSQRRELTQLAAERGIIIVDEITDVVESAKTEHRPGFQQLIRELKLGSRTWDTLLVVDTSRLSRRRYVAHVFKHECERRGVAIVYSKVPETDPISQVILHSVLEAMDEVHSLMSREKGLAGMAENVRRGWRAGGRPPRGYKLQRVRTDAVRDGQAVYKTRLEPSADAPAVRRYLQLRASDTPRSEAIARSSLKMSVSSLVDLEWNALTYAGHTVWNMRASREEGRYKGGHKRRPRDEWVIQRDTHPALITDAEANALMSRLESSDIGRAVSQAKSGGGAYLLSGFLFSPDGTPWNGHRGSHYRFRAPPGKRGRLVARDAIETAVTTQLFRDMRSKRFVRALVTEARKHAHREEDPAKELRAKVVQINKQVSRAMELALELESPAPALRKVDELERERAALAAEITRLESEHTAAAALAQVTERQVHEMLDAQLAEMDPESVSEMKTLLRALIERVTLDPATLECRVRYRIEMSERWLSMASPGVRGGWPHLTGESAVKWATG